MVGLVGRGAGRGGRAGEGGESSPRVSMTPRLRARMSSRPLRATGIATGRPDIPAAIEKWEGARGSKASLVSLLPWE